MIIRNDNDLIGDFIGTIPAMQAAGAPVVIKDHMTELFGMAGLRRSYDEPTHSFDLHESFAYADKNSLHMIQSNFAQIGLPVPKYVPRPVLNFHEIYTAKYDYVLAPFSRSLPKDQLWQREKWQALVNAMPDKRFCLMGSLVHDDPSFVTGANVTSMFGQSWVVVCNIMKRSELISVVTGLSHLAYALGVKNYLFFNQGRWGQNPEAVLMQKHIPDITVEEVVRTILAL